MEQKRNLWVNKTVKLDTPEVIAMLDKQKKQQIISSLFENLIFFLNREVPRKSLEFVIKSFGGQVGYESPSSPYLIDDPKITHHIIDRYYINSKLDPH